MKETKKQRNKDRRYTCTTKASSVKGTFADMLVGVLVNVPAFVAAVAVPWRAGQGMQSKKPDRRTLVAKEGANRKLLQVVLVQEFAAVALFAERTQPVLTNGRLFSPTDPSPCQAYRRKMSDKHSNGLRRTLFPTSVHRSLELKGRRRRISHQDPLHPRRPTSQRLSVRWT